MKTLNGLTGLRFIAASYVFIFHIQLRLGLSFLPAPVSTFVSQGALGVNIFFVLSGFILTYAHLIEFTTNKLPTWSYYKSFLIKRIARIYPVYLVGLLACAFVSTALDFHPKEFDTAVILDTFLLQSYVPRLSMVWYGSGGWSISTEFFFYLLFPFILFVLLRIECKSILQILLVFFVILSALPGFIYVLFPEIPFEVSYTFPLSRLPEFACGIILGLLVFRNKVRVPEWSAVALSIAAFLYLVKFGTRFPGYTVHNLVFVPVIMANICVLIDVEHTRTYSWVGAKYMQYLGKISFSFYIIQIALMLLLDGLLAMNIIHKGDNWLLLPILIFNLLLAILLYEIVEKKAHLFILNKFVKSNRV